MTTKRSVFQPVVDWPEGDKAARPAVARYDYRVETTIRHEQLAELHTKVGIGGAPILEISTYSRDQLGRALSAFNLTIDPGTDNRAASHDWLWINTIVHRPALRDALLERAREHMLLMFSDVCFDPDRHVASPAGSAAELVALDRCGRLEEALASPRDFLRVCYW